MALHLANSHRAQFIEMHGPRVVVVGAGIAGLAAANRIQALGVDDVLVLEADGRLGGKIARVDLGGLAVDAGPESFITRNPVAAQLCAELGLSAELVAPAPLGAQLWVRGRLRPLPREMSLGIPRRMWSIAASGALSPAGVLRAALERVLPVHAPDGDVSVGRLVRARFGDEAFEGVVDPLLSGIYAGNGDRLSAESVVPHLVDALRHGRRLSSLQVPESTGPAFLTLRGGLGRVVESIAARLPATAIRLGTRATGLDRDGSGYRVTLDSGEEIATEHVIVATPPAAAARLLRSLSSRAATLLATIESAAVATVTMRFASGVSLPPSSGFLVPRTRERILVGCTFLTRKWPHLASSGAVLIRCAVGREGSQEWQSLDDEELVRAVRTDLEKATGIDASPQATAICRFFDGIPQYHVRHAELVEAIDASIEGLPRLALAGAAYRGVGVPACIASGRRAAEAVLSGARSAVA